VNNLVVDTDDLYNNKDNRETMMKTRRIRNNSIYYTPNYGWYGYGYSYGYQYQIFNSRAIIVLPNDRPNTNYGKRPTREGHNNQIPPSLNRRGRN